MIRSRNVIPRSVVAVISLAILLVIAIPPAAAQPAPGPCLNPQVRGCWGPLLQWNIEAIHSIALKTGKVLIINPSNPNQCRLFDPATDTVGPIFSGPANHWLFCAGHSQIPDGRIVFAGGIGGGIGGTSLFNPDAVAPAQWSTPDAPPAQRFYPTCTTLARGNVLVTAGDAGDPNSDTPNTFDAKAPTGLQWDILVEATFCDASLSCAPPIYNFHINYYPFMFQLSSGNVLFAGSETLNYDPTSPKTRLLNPVAETWTDLFAAPDAIIGGSAVHFLPNRVMKAGGYDSTFTVTNQAYTLDMNAAIPAWVQQPSMANARQDFYLVAMADGSILAIGGADQSFQAVLAPERFDPSALVPGWTPMAPMAVGRLYHSSTVLLPDARVVIGGGALTTGQVFWPPYLFDASGNLAPRPTITAAGSRNGIAYGQSFALHTPDATDIKEVNLVRFGASTHSFDHDQRFIPLKFSSDLTYLKVAPPETPYDAPPGYYMLFIVNGNGVPSKAAIVKLQYCI